MLKAITIPDKILECIDSIDTNGLDKNIFINSVDELINNADITLVEDDFDTDTDPVELYNQLSIGNTPVYISVTQIINNIKSGLFIDIIYIISKFFNYNSDSSSLKLSLEDIEVVKNILSTLYRTAHWISKDERCVYIVAIELYLKDPKAYHNPNDFYPKLLSNYCDNLTISCSHRRNKTCSFTKRQLNNALISLEKKHVLEGNNGEYRYIYW